MLLLLLLVSPSSSVSADYYLGIKLGPNVASFASTDVEYLYKIGWNIGFEFDVAFTDLWWGEVDLIYTERTIYQKLPDTEYNYFQQLFTIPLLWRVNWDAGHFTLGPYIGMVLYTEKLQRNGNKFDPQLKYDKLLLDVGGSGALGVDFPINDDFLMNVEASVQVGFIDVDPFNTLETPAHRTLAVMLSFSLLYALYDDE